MIHLKLTVVVVVAYGLATGCACGVGMRIVGKDPLVERRALIRPPICLTQ